MAEAEIVKLDDENFNETVGSGVTLVDFYADWCGPCRMLAPVFEEVAGSMSGKAKFGKLDIDKSSGIAGKNEVTSVPTMILFKDGKEFNRLIGLRDKNAIEEFVSSAL